jgi:uncharacterized protein
MNIFTPKISEYKFMENQTIMRRKDREVTDFTIIKSILDKAVVINIGMYDGKQPYIVPLNYGYTETDGQVTFYMHCATEGRKLDILKVNPEVCFELDVDRVLKQAPKACGWSMFFKSLMGYGKIEIVTDEAERVNGMSILMDHYNPDGASKPYDFSKFIERTVILKMKVDSISCKVKGTFKEE